MMHELNPYKNKKPDFSKLSEKYPDLKRCLSGRTADGAATLNWGLPESSRVVSQVLLKEDFGLDVELIRDRLCPPLPNRINYLCWLEEIFQSCNKAGGEETRIYGCLSMLDIGVGASCIYPMLGLKLFQWSFVGSDIDESSVQEARRNVQKNSIDKNISIVSVESSEALQNLILRAMAGGSDADKGHTSTSGEVSDDDDDGDLAQPLDNISVKNSTVMSSILASLCQCCVGSEAAYRGPLRKAVAAISVERAAQLNALEEQWFRDQKKNSNEIPDDHVNLSLDLIDSSVVGSTGCAESDPGEVPAAAWWLRASMTNPPFYALDEEVFRCCVSALIRCMNELLLIII